MKRLVIFDLDGTLLNTISDLGQACNHALLSTGFPCHPLDSYPMMVGNGITRLIERALPAEHRDQPTVELARRYFLDFYGQHCMELTQPYPGIGDLLSDLASRGIMVAVASNKYQEAVTALISHYFPEIPWTAVEGQRDTRPTKPSPDIVFNIMTTTGVEPADVLYVGDSGVDIDTARNAGVDCAGVTWGFRPESELREHGAVHLVHKASSLLDMIE